MRLFLGLGVRLLLGLGVAERLLGGLRDPLLERDPFGERPPDLLLDRLRDREPLPSDPLLELELVLDVLLEACRLERSPFPECRFLCRLLPLEALPLLESRLR